MKFTEKPSALLLKSARTFGVVAVSVCIAMISFTPSIAQASQRSTSSKAKSELSTFLTFYDLFLNPCFKNLNSIFLTMGKGDLLDEQTDAQTLPGQCSLASSLFKTELKDNPPPLKAYPSLTKIGPLTMSWISEARILAAGTNDILLNKKLSSSAKASFNNAFRNIGPTGGQILNSIRTAITASKSSSIGKLPTIPSQNELLNESSADLPQ